MNFKNISGKIIVTLALCAPYLYTQESPQKTQAQILAEISQAVEKVQPIDFTALAEKTINESIKKINPKTKVIVLEIAKENKQKLRNAFKEIKEAFMNIPNEISNALKNKKLTLKEVERGLPDIKSISEITKEDFDREIGRPIFDLNDKIEAYLKHEKSQEKIQANLEELTKTLSEFISQYITMYKDTVLVSAKPPSIEANNKDPFEIMFEFVLSPISDKTNNLLDKLNNTN